MKILLDNLAPEGQQFECDFTFDMDATAFNVKKCQGVVKPEGAEYILDFDVIVAFKDNCDRCLKRFEEEFSYSAHLILSQNVEEESETPRIDDEIELTESDMSIYVIPDGVLDIKDIVTQETIISRPYKRLCSDDCSGICQGCGVDLNTEKCACEKDVDVRWQALKKYMTNQKQEI